MPLNASINLALAAADTRNRAPQWLKPLTLAIFVARLKSCPSRGCAKKSLRAEAFGVRIALRQEGYGRDARSPTIIRSKALLLGCFFLDHDLHVCGYIFVQLYRNGEIADRFQSLVQLDLAAIDVEAFFG